MSKYNWMPILRTGAFTAKNGKQVNFDESKIDLIIKNTDLKKEPQFVVEHPFYDKLGFGTFSELKRVGKYLFGLPKNVDEKFKHAVNNGELPGRSVSLDEDTLALSSIGFLPPEVSPAVDGLGVYSFSSDDTSATLQFSFDGIESHFAEVNDDRYEFEKFTISSWPFKTIKTIFRNLKNFLIEKYGNDEAEKIMPEWDLEESGNTPSVYKQEETALPQTQNYSSNTNGDKMKIDLSKFDLSKVDPALKALVESLANENTTLTTELDTTKTQLSAAEVAQLRRDVLSFCESDEVKLKIKPADKEKIVNFLMALKGKSVIEFSTPDNITVKLNPFDFAKEIIKNMPDVISFSEFASNSTAAGPAVGSDIKVGREIAALVNPKQ